MWYRYSENKPPKTLTRGPVDKELARAVGNALYIDWNKISLDEFQMGLTVEEEHGRGLHTNLTHMSSYETGQIALAHLNEIPDYYTRLRKMEKEGEDGVGEQSEAIQTSPITSSGA